MCQTCPQKIKSVKGTHGILLDGREVNLALIKNPKAGDWVIVNANLAINKITKKDAEQVLKLLNQKHA